jgi:hypothetical protein
VGTLLKNLDHQTAKTQVSKGKLRPLRLITLFLGLGVLVSGSLIGLTLHQHQQVMRPLDQESSRALLSLWQSHHDYRKLWGRGFPKLVQAQSDHYQDELLTLFDRRTHQLLSSLNQRLKLPPKHWIKSEGALYELKELISMMTRLVDDEMSPRKNQSIGDQRTHSHIHVASALNKRLQHSTPLKKLIEDLSRWSSDIDQLERSLSGSDPKVIALSLLKLSLQNSRVTGQSASSKSHEDSHAKSHVNHQTRDYNPPERTLERVYAHTLSLYKFHWYQEWFKRSLTDVNESSDESSQASEHQTSIHTLSDLIDLYHLIAERSLDLFGVTSLKLKRVIKQRWLIEWRRCERRLEDQRDIRQTLNYLKHFAQTVSLTQKETPLIDALTHSKRSLVPNSVMVSWRTRLKQLDLKALSIMIEQALASPQVTVQNTQSRWLAHIDSMWFGPLLSLRQRTTLRVNLESEYLRKQLISTLKLKRVNAQQLSLL